MDSRTIQSIIDLNNRFYSLNAQSFSETRSSAWGGWNTLASIMDKRFSAREMIRILDIACGNMRFERFVDESCACAYSNALALDMCEELACEMDRVTFKALDIIETLAREESLVDGLEPTEFDLTVCFGFMHHIPTFDLRKRLIKEMCGSTIRGGLICISFWQFMNDPAFADKVRKTHGMAQEVLSLDLDENDYLLGWQGSYERARYCHHFDDEEIDALMVSVPECRLVERYQADGRTGAMNCYIVLERE